MLTRALLLAACLHAGPALAGQYGVEKKGDGWTYTRLGNPNDIIAATTPGFAFEGGGADVDALFTWLCDKAGNGDILILRYSGDGAYNPYIKNLCPNVNSVSTLRILNQTGANDAFVANTIGEAEAIFIAGGDPANYINFWAGTATSNAINNRVANGVPFGGTSAGESVMGEFAFSALAGGVGSKVAMMDCYGPDITIEQGFLSLTPLLDAVITDQHFENRNRMGRLVTFLAQMVQNQQVTTGYGIAVNGNTALLMDADGAGTVVGSSKVYFLRTPGPPQTCVKGQPVAYANVSVYSIDSNGTFDVAGWTGQGGTAYTVSVANDKVTSTQAGGSPY
jgi:cyanophycinase